MYKITIPATSANIGPGFDCLGLALQKYNTFYFKKSNETSITGCPKSFINKDNLTLTAFDKTMHLLNQNHNGIRIHFQSDIPISRGLGSSSTCILAGILAANAYAGYPLSKSEILDIAIQFENHPDNLAPALYGGFTVSVMTKDGVVTDNITLDDTLFFMTFVPNFKLLTEEARKVLPHKLSYQDSIYNTSRAALLVNALVKKRMDLLKVACDDALHQPYRKTLIKDYDAIFKTAYQNGAHGVFLSGAGPTIVAITTEKHGFLKNVLPTLDATWQLNALKLDTKGAMVERGEHYDCI